MIAQVNEEFDCRTFLKSLTHRPGVYRMLNANGKVIYVGKARSLKRRVSSYFHRSVTDPKTTVLMQLVTTIEVTLSLIHI